MGYEIVVVEAPLNAVDNGILSGLGETPVDSSILGTNPSGNCGNPDLQFL